MPAQRPAPRTFSGPPLADTRTGAPRKPFGPGELSPAAIHLPSGDQAGLVVVIIGGFRVLSLRASEPSRRAEVQYTSLRVRSTVAYTMRCPSGEKLMAL